MFYTVFIHCLPSFCCCFFQQNMASFGEKLETWLRCPVCQETVRQPKTLECFHTFCEGCVAQLTRIMKTEQEEGVKCPVCRAFTDQKQIKTNVLVTEMLEAHQGRTTSVEPQLCSPLINQGPYSQRFLNPFFASKVRIILSC